ncbi:hypothetical protein DRE_04743 [Drechslerella stenobrocha 248]|uniref:protein-histidine N-methyltransferase n=1 Tax=Drechslerella stenobrocha 248 TaxID=1043628 RepID=W7IA60_9PEZI|nr:hypothetical protein DRE_04743 [Drechslerella stenobrocha 248]
MSFKFNFDLPADEAEDGTAQADNDKGLTPPSDTLPDPESAATSQTPASAHTLDELISQLPPHITYSVLELPVSSSRTVCIPRRELFDVKMQLMAEDTMATGNKFTAAFTNEDIRTDTYEGGLKSWECSSDLVKQLAQDDDVWRQYCRRVLELGCGTALPTCYILQALLSPSLPSPGPVHLTLADYNIDVLRLVTLPNLLLAYAHATSYTAPPADPQGEAGTLRKEGAEDEAAAEEPNEMELTSHLISSFTSTLAARNITISFLSGCWSPTMAALHNMREGDTAEPATLLLASETIYSPRSIVQFADVVEHTLDGAQGRGYIAAKDVYFGVGGSVADFVALIRDKGWAWEVVREEKKGAGVGRVVMVVRKGV